MRASTLLVSSTGDSRFALMSAAISAMVPK